jgi:hypothetical protein
MTYLIWANPNYVSIYFVERVDMPEKGTSLDHVVPSGIPPCEGSESRSRILGERVKI